MVDSEEELAASASLLICGNKPEKESLPRHGSALHLGDDFQRGTGSEGPHSVSS